MLVLIPGFIRERFRCHVLRPLLRLLRGGVTPRRLAWSLALGMAVGINPSVGLTTLFVVLVAWIFGLSKLASLIGRHVVAPLHLLLFILFIELGVHLFHTRRLPIDRKRLEHLSHHPLQLFHEIWQREWHALVVWGLLAGVAMPLVAVYVRWCCCCEGTQRSSANGPQRTKYLCANNATSELFLFTEEARDSGLVEDCGALAAKGRCVAFW